MQIQLHPDSALPLYLQLRDALRAQILSGAMQQGQRLPSARALSAQLHVSRTTVEEAYRCLMDDGLVFSSRGKGMFTAQVPQRSRGEPLVDWEGRVSGEVRRYTAFRSGPGAFPLGERETISFASLSPDHSLFMVEAFRKCLNDAMSREGGYLLGYGYTRGYEPLRRCLTDYLASKGISSEGQELLVTNGFRQGLEMLCRTLLTGEGAVAVEMPCYNGALGLLTALGAKILPIPMDEKGMDPAALAETLDRQRVCFIYCTPSYQNPTGRIMDLPRRQAILQLAARHRTPVIEDGFTEELRYSGEGYPSLKALDEHDLVVYVGSFSKVLFPGLRVGWVLAAQGLMRYLVQEKHHEDIHTGLLQQAGLYEFLNRGYLEKQLRISRQAYAARMAALERALPEYLPELTVESGQGGFCLWARLPAGVDARKLLSAARARGVIFAPGDAFYPDGRGLDHIRLGFSRLEPEQIAEGARRLARALDDIKGGD